MIQTVEESSLPL